MKVILIDLDSINRNPNAGQMYFNQYGNTDITFKYEGAPNQYLIDKFNTEREDDDADGFFLTQISLPTHNKFMCSGVLLDSSFIPNLLEKIPGVKIESNREVIRIETMMPQSKYLYKYIPTSLECSSCKSMVLVDEIIDGYEHYGDSDYEFDECPICERQNTFPERKYETIDEALKRNEA